MKAIRIISIFSLMFFLFAGCEKEKKEMPPPFMESFADVEECLSFPPLKSDQPGPDESCFYYEYDGDSTMRITHYNAGFNCCPEKILTSFELRNDTIFIVEDDSLQLCRCNCLFNVEMTIHNLPPGRYMVKIEEPFVTQADQVFILDIDLLEYPIGRFCKTRDFYPWGVQ